MSRIRSPGFAKRITYMSISLKIYNQEGKAAGEIELSSKVFEVKMNEALVHQAVVAQMGNERQVLAHTKGRGDVSGGGKKPWKQKGTGRARAGSSRSPLWKGGGVVFGPQKDRNFKKELNRKMRQKAMFMVLSDKINAKSMAVVESLNVEEFKTKKMDAIVKNFETKIFTKNENKKRSVLLINDKKDLKSKNSARNLAGVKAINLDNINILDLLKYKNVILSAESVKSLETTYSSKKAE